MDNETVSILCNSLIKRIDQKKQNETNLELLRLAFEEKRIPLIYSLTRLTSILTEYCLWEKIFIQEELFNPITNEPKSFLELLEAVFGAKIANLYYEEMM